MNNDHIVWMGQSITGTHLKYISKADITYGLQCGYISPIPFISFGNKLSENDFRLFINAIGYGFASWDSVKNIIKNKGISYADENVIKKEIISEVKEAGRLKFVPCNESLL